MALKPSKPSYIFSPPNPPGQRTPLQYPLKRVGDPPPSCGVEDDLGLCQDESDEDSQKTLKLPGFFARFGILTVITMARSWAIGQADHFYGRSPRHRARQVQGRPRISVPLRVCFPRKQGQPGTPPPTPRKSRPSPQVEIFERTPSVLDQQLGC